MEEDKILAAISELGNRLETRFETLEQRLTEQERQSKKASKASRKASEVQRQQGADIERLKQIVYTLAEKEPLRRWECPPSAAIRKETAYADFERNGISRREAARLLDEAGVIRHDRRGKRAPVIQLDGKVRRVLIVELGDPERAG